MFIITTDDRKEKEWHKATKVKFFWYNFN